LLTKESVTIFLASMAPADFQVLIKDSSGF